MGYSGRHKKPPHLIHGTTFVFKQTETRTKKQSAMKTLHTIYALLAFTAASIAVNAQDYPEEYLGLPGDNLNLYAVMNLFQESETLEGFERSLNDNESMINNLDLNGDNLIDYITVSDYVEGNVHTIVLRAALNNKEQQDVAVFVVEKLRNGAVQIQLIGDEALYGPNYIVEPIYAETPNPGYTGNVYRSNANVVSTTYYDIAAWPLVRFIYYPGYVAWRSSWYWGYYPTYWRPWRPHYWHYYYGYHYHWHNYYYSHYHHWNHFRSRYYATYYRPRVRVYSPTVVVNINNGRYRNTYSRPDQRREGEAYYNRTASNRSRPGVSANGSNRSAVRTNSNARNNNARTMPARTTTRGNASSVNRSTSSRGNASSVNRSTSSRGNASSVQRSTSSRGTASSVQRSTSSRSNTPAVQRSTSSNSRKSSATVSRSSSPRSTPSVQRSSSSRSTPSVKRSSSSSSRSSSVQRSQPSKSRSSVQRSSSSRKSSGSSKSSSSRSSSSRSSSASRR